MKLTLSFTFLSLAIFSFIIPSHVSSSSLPSVSFVGIPPQDEDYFKDEVIKCKNGSKKFTKTQLNDDFCDCPDGTDEPGTSACPQGKFYCRNAGHSSSLLFSSRVNDGICDCCDGSDEYDGKVKCPNTCWEAGKAAREKLKKKIEMYHEGVALRKQEIEQAKQAIARDKAELLGLKNEKEVLEKVVKQLEEQIQKLKQRELLEKEDKIKEASNEKIENEKSGPEENVDGQIEPLKISDVEKMGLSGESPSDQSEKDENESTEGLSREELGRLIASRWTGKKTGDQVEEIDPAKSDHMGNRDKEESAYESSYDEHIDNNALQFNEKTQKHQEKGRKDARDAEDEESVAEDREKSSDIATLSHQSWLVKIQETAQNFLQSVNLFSAPVANLDANQVRKEYDNYTAKLSDIELRISSLTEKFKYDFGREKEFYLFYDRCFESKQDKYVYKVCPFKDAIQEEGSSETRLGNWEKFGNSYRMMMFSNGDGCWNGPDRSLKVTFICG
ncbi:glucosidase 2 subunit beta-like isoform X1 [Durio zibethinus]|uniref:Glucosidase 2 subunit beta n=1 Tax=Durio zibethinus TaxID=66656 RepID=A0A6P5Z1V4_DURZI|nr:glucosidase 2 subunit beta-like isoform X1 [Durio zibethinus]